MRDIYLSGWIVGWITLFCCIYRGSESRYSTHNGVFIHARPGISAAFELEIRVCVRVIDIILQDFQHLQHLQTTVLFPIGIFVS